MPQLIKLRQRIKLIGTIQKITQAMRLVSMSVHSRLNQQLIFIKNYRSELGQAINAVNDPNLSQFSHTNAPKLIILIGTQKGLCGSFNQEIMHTFEQQKTAITDYELLVIGKKLIDTVQRKYQITHKIPKFAPTAISEISNKIFNYITKQKQFSEVICISNQPKSFFAHITTYNTIVAEPKHIPNKIKNQSDPYAWEQTEASIGELLYANQLKLNIYCSLFDSLIAEYAARFRSMDNASRNASSLLEAAERQYAKARQTKITRELIELSAIFQTK